jgi:hypothetical protein
MARMKHYVVVRHQPGGLPYLFDAPLYADIQKGDEVYCETAKGINKAVVVSKFKTDEDSFLLRKVKEICGLMPGTKIKHIESVVKRVKLDYTEEIDEGTTTTIFYDAEGRAYRMEV